MFANYVLEIVPSGDYYYVQNDTTDTWSFGLDVRINLPALGGIRPYAGTGFVRQQQTGESGVLLNISGGIYFRVRGNRVIPFVEGAYRDADDLNH